MKLIWKLSIPQICIVICLGLISFVVIHSSFTGMRERYVTDIVESRFKRIHTDIASNAQEAVNLSAIFARIPEVLEAYAVALGGRIDDPDSPESQQAREMLRKTLAPMLGSYKELSGESMQLHYHLPNGRSLVRLWRDKQTRVKGEWKDVSDDLSSFRPTVMDVNRSGRAVKGIELGSGGFAVRGVVPVRASDGKQVGSVEMLRDFNAILASATVTGQNEMLLYINADLLPIATALQDKQKNPHVGDFVRVTKPEEGSRAEAYITPEFLTAGKTGTVYEHHGSLTLATLPIADYKNTQVGVLVCAIRTDALMSLMLRSDITLVVMLAGMALAPFAALMIGLRMLVTKPLVRVREKIQDIADDRADLNEPVDSRQRDEIGELARSFNTLMAKLASMLDEMDGYVSMLNTVPDPVFVVDEDSRILLANKATLDYLGTDMASLKGQQCGGLFKANVCGTNLCPVEAAKRKGGREEGEIIELCNARGCTFVKPSADILYNSKGKKMGYVEVAKVVTDLVLSERTVNEKLDRIRSVNEATREAAEQLTLSTSGLGGLFDNMQEALGRQHGSLNEAVSVISEMNGTVRQVAGGAAQAAEQSQAAREEAESGAAVVEKSMQAILRVSEQAESMKVSMHDLGRQAQEIGAVLGVISDIADQTNLLALNAAIEAARAGEAGRGFAVVADEVRKLAEKTVQATHEVEKVISSIRNGVQESVRMVEQSGDLAAEANSLASQSGEALQNIVERVAASSEQARGIAKAAEGQRTTSENINRIIEQAVDMATDVAGRMQASAQSVSELSELAAKLDNLSKG